MHRLRTCYLVVLTCVTLAALTWIVAPAPTFHADALPTPAITPLCVDTTCAAIPGATPLVDAMRPQCSTHSVEVYVDTPGLAARCHVGNDDIWATP